MWTFKSACGNSRVSVPSQYRIPTPNTKKCHDHLISANDGCSRTVWRSDVSTALPSPSHHHQIIIHSHQQNWETMTRQITGEEQQLTSPGGRGEGSVVCFVHAQPRGKLSHHHGSAILTNSFQK
ncbi:hypothetical protein niasHT_021504 [Heterodera trifolii]|uniref:Uncharacterized protein n=1 Tax=Heterodera trifolii TaxID=157864 RepID=A0ABD2KEQ6_9BILA